jgi:hypothetical protein
MTLSCYAFPLKSIYIKNNTCKRIHQLFKSIYRHVLVYHEKPMKEYFVADDIDIDVRRD